MFMCFRLKLLLYFVVVTVFITRINGIKRLPSISAVNSPYNRRQSFSGYTGEPLNQLHRKIFNAQLMKSEVRKSNRIRDRSNDYNVLDDESQNAATSEVNKDYESLDSRNETSYSDGDVIGVYHKGNLPHQENCTDEDEEKKVNRDDITLSPIQSQDIHATPQPETYSQTVPTDVPEIPSTVESSLNVNRGSNLIRYETKMNVVPTANVKNDMGVMALLFDQISSFQIAMKNSMGSLLNRMNNIEKFISTSEQDQAQNSNFISIPNNPDNSNGNGQHASNMPNPHANKVNEKISETLRPDPPSSQGHDFGHQAPPFFPKTQTDEHQPPPFDQQPLSGQMPPTSYDYHSSQIPISNPAARPQDSFIGHQEPPSDQYQAQHRHPDHQNQYHPNPNMNSNGAYLTLPPRPSGPKCNDEDGLECDFDFEDYDSGDNLRALAQLTKQDNFQGRLFHSSFDDLVMDELSSIEYLEHELDMLISEVALQSDVEDIISQFNAGFEPTCPYNVPSLQIDDRCFSIELTHLNYEDAQRFCSKRGGTLAQEPLTVSLWAEITKAYPNFKTREMWIGATDTEQDGNFVFSNGDVVSQTDSRWQHGSPTLSKFKNRDCLALDCVEALVFKDMNCKIKQHFICEYPTASLIQV